MSDNLTAKKLWLADYSNRICADCHSQKTTIVCLNCWVFVCNTCGNIHKTSCHHKTAHFESNQVTAQEIGLLKANGGNTAINSKYLANYHDDISISRQRMTQFITSKYIKKKWYRKDTNNKDTQTMTDRELMEHTLTKVNDIQSQVNEMHELMQQMTKQSSKQDDQLMQPMDDAQTTQSVSTHTQYSGEATEDSNSDSDNDSNNDNESDNWLQSYRAIHSKRIENETKEGQQQVTKNKLLKDDHVLYRRDLKNSLKINKLCTKINHDPTVKQDGKKSKLSHKIKFTDSNNNNNYSSNSSMMKNSSNVSTSNDDDSFKPEEHVMNIPRSESNSHRLGGDHDNDSNNNNNNDVQVKTGKQQNDEKAEELAKPDFDISCKIIIIPPGVQFDEQSTFFTKYCLRIAHGFTGMKNWKVLFSYKGKLFAYLPDQEFTDLGDDATIRKVNNLRTNPMAVMKRLMNILGRDRPQWFERSRKTHLIDTYFDLCAKKHFKVVKVKFNGEHNNGIDMSNTLPRDESQRNDANADYDRIVRSIPISSNGRDRPRREMEEDIRKELLFAGANGTVSSNKDEDQVPGELECNICQQVLSDPCTIGNNECDHEKWVRMGQRQRQANNQRS